MKSIRDYIRDYYYPNWPKSASMEDWAVWHKEAKKRKFPYWMTRTMPSWFAVKNMQLYDVKMQFKYRFQKRHRYHLIDTGLGYGYHEIENRMLHGMFNMLKDFVEVEKAHLHNCSYEKPKIKLSKRDAGLAHLDWEIALTHDKDYVDHIGKPELSGKPTDQAITAQKIKDLYLWWTEERPHRIDPWDEEFKRRENDKEDVRKDIYDMWAET